MPNWLSPVLSFRWVGSQTQAPRVPLLLSLSSRSVPSPQQHQCSPVMQKFFSNNQLLILQIKWKMSAECPISRNLCSLLEIWSLKSPFAQIRSCIWHLKTNPYARMYWQYSSLRTNRTTFSTETRVLETLRRSKTQTKQLLTRKTLENRTVWWGVVVVSAHAAGVWKCYCFAHYFHPTSSYRNRSSPLACISSCRHSQKVRWVARTLL